MTTIEKYLPVFEAYFGKDVNAGEKQVFETALKNDEDMQSAWEEYRSMMDAFSDKEAIRLRLSLREAFYNQERESKVKYLAKNLWFRLSAAAVIIITMGCLLYFFCSGGRRLENFAESHKAIPADTIKSRQELVLTDSHKADTGQSSAELINKDQPPVQIASLFDQEEYQVSPVFAELLHNVYRSGWFHLISPEDSVMFSPGDSIVFSWETNIKESLYFDILDRNGRVIYKHTEAITSPWSFRPNLSPAIYMYRFATAEEPVWMGVFATTK
jgi:hypothetical protein